LSEIDLLASKLAKGEISLEEFTRMKNAIPAVEKPKSTDPKPQSGRGLFLSFAAVAVAVFGVYLVMQNGQKSAQASATSTASNNDGRQADLRRTGALYVTSYGKTKSGSLVDSALITNESDAYGLVIVTVDNRSGLTYCEQSFEIEANSRGEALLNCEIPPPRSEASSVGKMG
jgi:hypothetical protein